MDAYALRYLNQYPEAVQEDEQALAIFDALAVGDPANSDLIRNTEVAEMDLCEMLARSGRLSRAISHCQTAIRIGKGMYRADSNNAQASEDIASGYATLGFVLHQDERLRDALAWDRRAIAQFETARAKDPDAEDAAIAYAEALLELASLENTLHEKMSCRHAEIARNLLQQVVLHGPEDAIVNSRLSTAREMTSCGTR